MPPNFLIAGVAKAGTTSLYYYLAQHPEVDIPRKESFYFAREFYENAPGDKPPLFRDKSRIIFSEEGYDKFYAHCHKKAIGEVSTCYAYLHESSIRLIKEKLGDIKIIFILRDPVERAFSAYRQSLGKGAELLSFKEALEAEKSRMEKRWDFMWYYADVGFYAKQIKAFKDNFSRVNIFLMEDLASRPQQVMKEVFQFIGVDDRYVPDTKFRYNVTDTKPPSLFQYLLIEAASKKSLKAVIRKVIPEKKRMAIKEKLRTPLETPVLSMDSDVSAHLMQLYRDDILEVEKLTGANLSGWRK